MEPVRFSRLKLMALSPAHYRANEVDETACMEQGSAADAIILGTRPVVAYPGKVRNGKAWEEWRDEHADSLIVTRRELDAAERMRDAVVACPDAVALLTGERQPEIAWQYLGRDCLSHPDVVGGSYVTDLKTSQSSDPQRFRWHALKMAYHAQLAFYRQATKRSDCYIVAIESRAPYVATCYQLTPRALEAGDKMIRLWFERLMVCESANQWPGYSQSIVDLDVEEDVALEF